MAEEKTDVPFGEPEKEYVHVEDLEKHFEANRRREARFARLQREAWRAELPCRVLGVALLLGAIGCVVAGGQLVGEADHDRLHGWHLSTCRIVRNFSPLKVKRDETLVPTPPPPEKEDHVTIMMETEKQEYSNVCIYFSVMPLVKEHGGAKVNLTEEPVCAVPARIAGHGRLSSPPACADLPVIDLLAVDYWRAVEEISDVECLVPVQKTVPLSRCASVATTGGVGTMLWRTYLDRFVYLVRDPREGTEALTAATNVQRHLGISLVAIGSLVGYAGFLLMGWRCWCGVLGQIARTHAEVRSRIRDRHFQRHKMY